jgi:hypothetical protein
MTRNDVRSITGNRLAPVWSLLSGPDAEAQKLAQDRTEAGNAYLDVNADPDNRDLMTTMMASEMLTGNDPYCLNFNKAYRAGVIGPPK